MLYTKINIFWENREKRFLPMSIQKKKLWQKLRFSWLLRKILRIGYNNIWNAYRKVVIAVSLSGQPTLYDVWFSKYEIWTFWSKKGSKRDFPHKFFRRLCFGVNLNPMKYSSGETALSHLTSRSVQIYGGLYSFPSGGGVYFFTDLRIFELKYLAK